MKLSQYRQGGSGAAGGRADVAGGGMQEGEVSRALLSNTDKEVIFDGLKKLYRKKVQCGNVGWRRKALCHRM